MEEPTTLVTRIREALEAKRRDLDLRELPALKEQFRLLQSAFQGIYTILIKKGALHEDPYKYDSKISEVSNPSESSFAESEKQDQMSIRLSAYDSQLDFLNNFYQFSVEFLDMSRVKRLFSFVKYIQWGQVSVSSSHIITRALAELISQVKNPADTLATGIMNDALLHLEQASKAIQAILKSLANYHRESAKLAMRETVFAGQSFERDYVVTHKEEVIKSLKRRFAMEHGEKPFYADLAEEILDEDYAQDAEARRDKLFASLAVQKKEEKQESAGANYKTMLLDAIKVIASVHFQITDALAKLLENQAVLENEDSGFFSKVARIVRRIFGSSGKEVVHELEFQDPVTGLGKNEKLNFTRFIEDLEKRAKLYAGITNKTGPLSSRLAGSSEDNLYSFSSKQIEELQATLRNLEALDTFYKTEVSREDREKLRGIKVEISTIKNTIIKANQKRHEYISKKEEIEQLKRLGIKAST